MIAGVNLATNWQRDELLAAAADTQASDRHAAPNALMDEVGLVRYITGSDWSR
jgi:hypothetical protein